MKDSNIINFYTLIALSISTACLLIMTVIIIIRAKNGQQKKSFSTLLIAIGIYSAITIITVIINNHINLNIIFNISLCINSIAFLILIPISMIFQRKELYELHKKENERKKYVEKLKNQPFEESNRAQHLLLTSRDLLNKASQSITGKKDITEDIYNYAVKAFKDDLVADGAVLLIADGIEETLSVKALTGEFPPPYQLPEDVVRKKDRVNSNFKYAEFKFGESIFSKIAKTGNIELIKNGSKSELLPNNGTEDFLQHGSLIFFPLVANEEIIGIAAVSRNPDKKPFEKYDSKMGGNLAGYVSEVVNLAVTINEANAYAEIENISDTASKIQNILLPKNFKKIQKLDISEYFLPARGICSDYYDVISNNEKIFIIVADVAGKSVQAAIIMVMIRTILYLITNSNKNTEEILDWLNKGITGKISIDHFASISIVCYAPKTQEIEFIGAGNQAMMICRKENKKIELYQQKTDPIGVDINSSYKAKKIPFKNGDTLALYTDGIVESLNSVGEQYGIKRLASRIIEKIEDNPKNIVKNIKSDIEAFIGRATVHDDHSLLIIKQNNKVR